MSLPGICPSVEVIWWTDTDFCIRCPYCGELHRHSFVSYRSARRVPHCGSRRPSYQFNFPVAYEIDKCKARFINIGAPRYLKDESEDEDERSLLDGVSNINISDAPKRPQSYESAFDDSTEMIVIPLDGEETLEERRILFAISDCVNGNISEVKNYLENSSDKLVFLHGHDRNGDTCLIMASQEKNSYMVSLLLDHGAEINATNENGRTALMEAALWGRLEIVELLLARGADLYLRDKKNRRAFDLALPTRQNRKERHTRAGGIWGDPSTEPVYKEDSISRDADRREITRVLERKLKIKSDLKLQVPESAYHSFRRSSLSIVHCGPIREYPIPSPSKTIAILERGNSFPTVAAMSGWGHSEWPSTRVSGKDWSRRVFELAALVGHCLSPHDWDQGIEGQFQASHAEKQLIAYFLDRHIFLPQDQTPDPRFDEEIKRLRSGIIDMACKHPAIYNFFRLRKDKWDLENELFVTDDRLPEEEYDEELVADLKERITCLNEQGTFLAKNHEVKAVKDQEHQIKTLEHEKYIHCRLNRLSKMAPQHTVSQATILISSPKNNICDDCLMFKDRVNHFFGLSIDLIECTEPIF